MLRFSDFGFQFSDFSFQERREETPVKEFFRFAQESCQFTRGSPLRIKPKQHGKTVEDLLSDIPMETLMTAWMLFLESDHKFIVEKKNPRTIPVFAIIVDDFLEQATKLIEGKNNNHLDPPKKANPPHGVDPAQVAKWEKCLQSIQAQILPENFETLFETMAFAGIQNGEAKIICPSKHYRDCVLKNYLDLIGGNMTAVFGEKVKLEFLLDTG